MGNSDTADQELEKMMSFLGTILFISRAGVDLMIRLLYLELI